MRPIDRAKRQEVWLYLSSFDFTSWGSLDLMSPDFQLKVESLLIQFVQRNRSFFGEQGRKRMTDIRMLISTAAAAVVQGLRNHLAGQKQGNSAFGSPRPVVSWATLVVKGRPEPGWDQVSASMIVLQQQLQELRGEIKPAASPSPTSAPVSPRPIQSRIVGPGAERDRSIAPPLAPAATPPGSARPMQGAPPSVSRSAPPLSPAATTGPSPMLGNPVSAPPLSPAATMGSASMQANPVSMPPLSSAATMGQLASPHNPVSAPPLNSAATMRPQAGPTSPVSASPMGTRQPGPLNPPVEPQSRRRSEPLVTRIELSPASNPLPPKAPAGSGYVAPISGMVPTPTSAPSRGLTQPTPKVTQAATGQRDASIMPIGEDDIAIFDQMRHQLLVWMRIEAVKAGLDISNLGPAQLLEILRQQGRIDETRLQVVSTLLNLSNQVVRTGMVSILDYKQALMFHLMHTKR